MRTYAKIILWRDPKTGLTHRGAPCSSTEDTAARTAEYHQQAAELLERLQDDGLLPETSWTKGADDIWAWLESETDGGERIRVYPKLVEFDGIQVWPEQTSGPACHVQGQVGRHFGFITHNAKRPNSEPRCVEDLADDAGRKLWKDYESYTDNAGVHHEGPSARSVSNKEDFKSYLKLTGQRVSDRGQQVSSPLERMREKVRKQRRYSQ